MDSDPEDVIDSDPTDQIVSKILSDVNSDLSSIDSNKEYMTKLKNEIDFNSDVEELEEPELKKGEREIMDIVEDKIYEAEEIKMNRNKIKVLSEKKKSSKKVLKKKIVK